MAEPGRCPRVVEPGTEIQIRITGGCRRGARRGACADALACNFLATEAVADGRLCGGRTGGPGRWREPKNMNPERDYVSFRVQFSPRSHYLLQSGHVSVYNPLSADGGLFSNRFDYFLCMVVKPIVIGMRGIDVFVYEMK